MQLRLAKLAVGLVATALIIAGCGGTGAIPTGGDQAVPAPPPAGGAGDPSPAGEVTLEGDVTAGTREISGIAFAMRRSDDRVRLGNGAESHVKHRNGQRARVPLQVANQGRALQVGRIPLEVGMNIFEIRAPKDKAIGLMDGRTKTLVFVRRVQIGFEMLDDGTIIAPRRLRLDVPHDDHGVRRLIARDMTPGDYMMALVQDSEGGISIRTSQADERGVAVVVDRPGGVTANDLSGARGLLGIYFARNVAVLP